MEIKANEITSEDGTKGFKGDFDNTNLQTIYEGLTFDKVYLVDGDDKKIDGEQVPLNSKFSIVVEGIKNFTLKDGKAFPKLSIMMTGETGLIVGEDDLLASYTEGMSVKDASVLRGTFTVAQPMAAGKMYSCIINIADKNNLEATIQSSWLFTVR